MEKVIEYLESEIDSLKTEYKFIENESQKSEISERILQFKRAIKILNEVNDKRSLKKKIPCNP